MRESLTTGSWSSSPIQVRSIATSRTLVMSRCRSWVSPRNSASTKFPIASHWRDQIEELLGGALLIEDLVGAEKLAVFSSLRGWQRFTLCDVNVGSHRGPSRCTEPINK
jgi:hypothetical protein